MPTCGRLIEIGLCPKMKNHPLCGWIFICLKRPYIFIWFNLIFILSFSILYIGSFDVVKAGNYEEK